MISMLVITTGYKLLTLTFRSIPLYRVDRFVGRNHTGMRADEQLQLGIYLFLSVSICFKLAEARYRHLHHANGG